MLAAIVGSISHYLHIHISFGKHRKRISAVKSKMSIVFQECYGECKPGNIVGDGLYLWGGIFYLSILSLLTFWKGLLLLDKLALKQLCHLF